MRLRDPLRSLLALGALLAFACGGGATPEGGTTPVEVSEAPPPPPFDPMAYMPADTYAVAEIDVAQVLASPYFETVWGWAELIDELDPNLIARVRSALDRTERVILPFASNRSGRSPELGAVILVGRYEPGELEGFLREAADSEDFQDLEIAGHRGIGNDDGALIQLDPGAWILGPRYTLDTVIANPARPAVLADARYLEAQQQLTIAQPAVVVTMATVNDVARTFVRRETPLSSEQAAHVQSGAAAVSVQSGVQGEIVVRTDDPALAQALAAEAQQGLGEAGQSMEARAMQLHTVAEQTEVQQDGTDVRVRMGLAAQEVEGMLGALDAFIQLALQARQQSGATATEVPAEPQPVAP
ncbi:MAG TPA: hypothetical protein RMH85_20395 [Polyangiaceae bacterium LLY-WYZ-15_(1-7)]|nr:hypothetical protein [Myxococcales bacterium]MAT23745.1 hypothetical protein [Sandaracinus sp.]HJL06260.1 hypothetical protein [Polyangiaceae bacterium LLY-WYZ-15_(1-7)]MBJ72973.1 hypothetical protein [Sandaracinus sp.]HJL10845.1 hypothetical protein [Polyangiaceae bacterium LLY-WYZ-15_(1-7)]